MPRETLGVRRRVLGIEHPDALGSASNLASTLYAQGQYTEATAWLKDTVEVQRRVLGAEHPETLRSARHLTGALYALGQCQDAV